MLAVPREVLGIHGLCYRIPKHRLSGADLGVATIELQPGAVIPASSHPGHEILILMSGKAHIVIGDVAGLYPLESGANLAHFESRRAHTIEDRAGGANPTKLLVLRCYRSQVEAS